VTGGFGKPATISDPREDTERPALAVLAKTGQAVATWTQLSGGPSSQTSAAAFASGSGGFLAPTEFPVSDPARVNLHPWVAIDQTGAATFMWLEAPPAATTGKRFLQVGDGRRGGPVTQTQTLATAPAGESFGAQELLLSPAVATSAGGDAVAAWTRSRDGKTSIETAVRTRADARFGPRTVLAQPGTADDSPNVAVNETTAVVVWSRIGAGGTRAGVDAALYSSLG
jgi:hypothetical protein